MHVRTTSCLLLLAILASGGCAGAGRPGGVPWWVGLPCLVIAPNSLEAEVWHEHLHARPQNGTALPDAVQDVEFTAEPTFTHEDLPPPNGAVPNGAAPDTGNAAPPPAPEAP